MADLTVESLVGTWRVLQQAADRANQMIAQMPPEWFLPGSYPPYEHIPIEHRLPGQQVQHKRIAWAMKPK